MRIVNSSHAEAASGSAEAKGAIRRTPTSRKAHPPRHPLCTPCARGNIGNPIQGHSFM